MRSPELVCDTLPVRKDSLDELLRHRERALELARQGVVILAEAEQAAKAAAPMETYAGFVRELFDRCGYALTHIEGDENGRERDALAEAMDFATKRIDMHAWQSLQRLSGLRNLMDAKATQDFAKQLNENPPPFTAANITATYTGLAAQSGAIFERGLVNVFHGLNTRAYRTNSAFRMGKRAVLTGVLGAWGWNHYGTGRETIADLDRCFHVLDGVKPPETSNAGDVMYAAKRKGEDQCDAPYFSARMFKNGNVHLTFKRLDLVDRANDIIAKHANGGLPDDTKVAA